MNIKGIVFTLWLVGSSTYIGLQQPIKEQPKDTMVTTVSAGGRTTIEINGHIVTQQAIPVVPIKQVEQPKVVKPVSAPVVIEGVEQWRSLVAKYFPSSQINNALRVMKAESGGTYDAEHQNRGGSVDRGLMQINSVHKDKVGGDLQVLFDPEVNIRVASEIYKDSGWNAWSTAHRLGL